MTGEKKSSDLPSRLSVKRGGKLISKTLGKSSSPPSISAPPKAAVGTSKVKKDEVQRRKNSFHDMLRGPSRDKDGERAMSTNVSAFAHSASRTPRSPGGSMTPSSAEPVPVSDKSTIMELEQALAAAKDETAALMQELERVKLDAKASVEISKYQATEAFQHAASEDSTRQMEVDNEVCQQDHGVKHRGRGHEEDLIDQNHDLRYRLAELQDQLISQSASSPPIPSRSDADWNALTLRLHETEKESQARLQQLLSLKYSISSLTRTDSQITDSELAELFSQLANRVREWVVSNYRRTKLDFNSISHETVAVLRSIKLDFENIDGPDKLALYQAIVSHMLMQIFNELVVVGMPGQGTFVGVEKLCLGLQDTGPEFREWRRATVRAIEQSELRKELLQERASELQILADKLERTLLSITTTKLTANARLAILGIFNSAADLQRTLCLQKAEYRVCFLASTDTKESHLTSRTMEPVNDVEYTIDEGSDAYIHRKFMFCVFPALEKLSDEVGDHRETGDVIFKARVCCGVG